MHYFFQRWVIFQSLWLDHDTKLTLARGEDCPTSLFLGMAWEWRLDLSPTLNTSTPVFNCICLSGCYGSVGLKNWFSVDIWFDGKYWNVSISERISNLERFRVAQCGLVWYRETLRVKEEMKIWLQDRNISWSEQVSTKSGILLIETNQSFTFRSGQTTWTILHRMSRPRSKSDGTFLFIPNHGGLV